MVQATGSASFAPSVGWGGGGGGGLASGELYSVPAAEPELKLPLRTLLRDKVEM